MTTEYTRPLSEFVSQVSYEDFPAPVVHQVKRSVLDSLACGLFSSHQPWIARSRLDSVSSMTVRSCT